MTDPLHLDRISAVRDRAVARLVVKHGEQEAERLIEKARRRTEFWRGTDYATRRP